MIEPTHVFWVGAIGMAAGTVAFLWGGTSAPRDQLRYYLVLAAISGIATVAYATMALEYGWILVDDRIVFAPRYVDWILTTPLLLVYLGLLAGLERREYALLIAVNTLVMVSGFAAALLSGVERFGLFALGGVAYLGLLYLLVGPVTAAAGRQSSGIESLFRSLRNLTVILWSIYPFVWLLGPPGLDLLTPTVDVMVITYLDLLTKVGFGLIALNASSVLEAELGATIGEAAD